MPISRLDLVPGKKGPGQQPTYSPRRLGGIATSLVQGDTVRAACAGALVPQTTYQSWIKQGHLAIETARAELEVVDLEGLIAEWLDDGGGLGLGEPHQWYWTADPPEWWPESLVDKWTHVVFAVVVSWARGRAEQVYRASITKAAQGTGGTPGDWRAAQFMLTHSFGWQNSERLELTGANGGPVQISESKDQALGVLTELARRDKMKRQEIAE